METSRAAARRRIAERVGSGEGSLRAAARRESTAGRGKGSFQATLRARIGRGSAGLFRKRETRRRIRAEEDAGACERGRRSSGILTDAVSF
jgi:hypothetical protein